MTVQANSRVYFLPLFYHIIIKKIDFCQTGYIPRFVPFLLTHATEVGNLTTKDLSQNAKPTNDTTTNGRDDQLTSENQTLRLSVNKTITKMTSQVYHRYLVFGFSSIILEVILT